MFKKYTTNFIICLFPLIITFSNVYGFDVRKTVNNVLGLNNNFEISSIEGALSSPGIFKIKTTKAEYVLRLFNSNMKKPEREKMIFCQKLASELQIAPNIIYIDPQNEFIISEYIKGEHLSKNSLLDNSLISELAIIIRKLHQIPNFPQTKDIFTVRKSFEKKAFQLNSDLIFKASQNLNLLDNLLYNKQFKAATHNDLKPENIIFNKRFTFIDWEAAGIGDPSFDIATIFVFYDLSKNLQNKFLEQYLGRLPNLFDKTRIELFRYEVLGYYGMAYLMLSVKNELKPLTKKEIYDLPRLSVFLKQQSISNSSIEFYIQAQKLGWILIKEINYNKSKINSLIKRYKKY